MPIHDWTGVEAGIFHHFHHSWIEEIQRALNKGLLPPDYYALAEQRAGGLVPDVITLQVPTNGHASRADPRHPAGGVALLEAPPKVQYRDRGDSESYAAKADTIAIHHVSRHQVVAMIEIVSPGNKNTRHGLRSFVEKAAELLRQGVHLLIVDLFPPSPRDPQGLHRAIWEEVRDTDFVLPPDKPLTLVAYIGGLGPEAFIEPTAVGSALIDMPLFLTPEVYVPVPLEATYRAAWEALPAFWRNVVQPVG